MSKRSFYDLVFRVQPGGARQDSHYVRASLDEIKADLAHLLTDGRTMYLLCAYGAELSLHVYQAGRLADRLGLHRLLTISIEGYPTITFSREAPVGFDFAAEDDLNEADKLAFKLLAGELEDVTTVAVDWDRLEVPPLTGRVVRDGDLVVLHEGEKAEYGLSDFEW